MNHLKINLLGEDVSLSFFSEQEENMTPIFIFKTGEKLFIEDYYYEYKEQLEENQSDEIILLIELLLKEYYCNLVGKAINQYLLNSVNPNMTIIKDILNRLNGSYNFSYAKSQLKFITQYLLNDN